MKLLQLFASSNDTSQKLILRLAHNYGSATVLSKSGTCSSFKIYQKFPIPLKGYENPGKFATLFVVLSIFNSLQSISIFLLLNIIPQFVFLFDSVLWYLIQVSSGILANTFQDIGAIHLFLVFIEDGKDKLVSLSYHMQLEQC